MLTTRPSDSKQDISSDELTHVELTIDLATLTCPITFQLFFEPVDLPCHHTFEKTAIKKWYKEKGESACCPACRRPFKTIHDSSETVVGLLDKVLGKYPQLNARRYCDTKLFDHHLDFKNEERLRKLVQLVTTSGKLIEFYDVDHKGILRKQVTRLYQLLGDAAGVPLVCRNRELVAQIDEEALNTSVTNGAHLEGSVLLRLAMHADGLTLLALNAELRHKITAEGLNTIFRDGMSVLFCLVNNPKGIELLDRDERLRNLISDHTLNQVVGTGFYKNDSPGSYLQSTSYGRAFLEKYPSIREKIKVLEAKPQMASLEIHDHAAVDQSPKSSSLGIFAQRAEQAPLIPGGARVPEQASGCVIL